MQYGVRAQTALPYAMNSEFSRTLASQMVHVCSIFQSLCIKDLTDLQESVVCLELKLLTKHFESFLDILLAYHSDRAIHDGANWQDDGAKKKTMG